MYLYCIWNFNTYIRKFFMQILSRANRIWKHLEPRKDILYLCEVHLLLWKPFLYIWKIYSQVERFTCTFYLNLFCTFGSQPYLHLWSSCLYLWKPALLKIVVDSFELVDATFAFLCDIFELMEKKSYYTCRGFICACGTFINTWSSLICTFVSHICTCGKLICSYGSPICTCASRIRTCDLYFFYNLEGLCHKQYLEFF